MQFDANSPIWLQVMNSIASDIVTGKRAPGEKLPGGRNLALLYSINPNTVARVYREMEDAAMVVTKRGMGTFVTEDKARIEALRRQLAESAVREFINKMRELGVSPEEAAQLLEREANHAGKQSSDQGI